MCWARYVVVIVVVVVGRLLQKRLQQHVGQGIVVAVVVVVLKADFLKRGYNNMLGKVWEDDLKQEVIIKITIR